MTLSFVKSAQIKRKRRERESGEGGRGGREGRRKEIRAERQRCVRVKTEGKNAKQRRKRAKT